MKSDSNDAMVKSMLTKFAEQAYVLDSSISRVTIGLGGKTPIDIEFLEKATPESMLEGKCMVMQKTSRIVSKSSLVKVKKRVSR